MADIKTSPFPNKKISEKKKNNDKEYHISWSKAIHGLWKDNKTAISSDDRAWFRLQRLYGSGNQPQEKYIDSKNRNELVTEVQQDEDGTVINKTRSARVGYNHIDNSNVSLMPRIKNRLKGYLNKIDYDISIDTIDDNSGAEKENKKNEMRVMMEHGDFINGFKQQAGIPIEKPMYMPQSEQELELFESINGFKLNSAIGMEKLIKHSFQISNWETFINDLAQDDVCDVGWIAGRVYFDNEDYKFKVKYVDPEFMIAPYHRYHDYSEMPWVGYFEQYTIADLRMELPDVDEEELMSLARNHCSKLNNPDSSLWESYNKLTPEGSYGYDDFLVWVLHTEWIDEEFYSKVDYTSKYGRKSRFVVESPEEREELKKKDKPNYQIIDYNRRILRSCSWVVDSDLCFDWGKSDFQVRPAKNKVIPSFIVERLNSKPLTEMLVPVMDDFKIAWMKFQDARSAAIKAGYALDFSMLQNIDDGSKKYSVIELIKLWRETGILLFQGSIDGRYEGGAVKPFFDVPGTVGIAMTEAIQMWTFAIQKLQDITGLSPVSLGAIAGQTATEAQLSTGAAVDILNPMVTKLLRFKERCSSSLISKLQLGVRYSSEIRKCYEPVVGKNDMQYLLDAEKSHVQYGQTFNAKPDDDYKKMIIDAANVSLNNRRQGLIGIDLATHTYLVERVMRGGNLSELRMVLAYQEQKYKEQLDKEKKESIELQNKGLAQIEQQKAQATQQIKSMEDAAAYKAFLYEITQEYVKAFPVVAQQVAMGMLGQNPNTQQMPAEGQQSVAEPLSSYDQGNVPVEQEMA